MYRYDGNKFSLLSLNDSLDKYSVLSMVADKSVISGLEPKPAIYQKEKLKAAYGFTMVNLLKTSP